MDGKKASKRKFIENEVVYNISVKTSNAFYNAGTTSGVLVNLLGKNCKESTGDIKLTNYKPDDMDQFEKGTLEHFPRKAKNVGLPEFIQLKLEKRSAKWFCDCIRIEIGNNGEKVKFPVYDWVVDEVKVARGEAILPQKVSQAYAESARMKEIEKNKTIFPWLPRPSEKDIGWGLPRYVNASSHSDLPELFRITDKRDQNFLSTEFSDIIKAIKQHWKAHLYPLNNLSSFKKLYDDPQLQEGTFINDNWCQDKTMGRQMLTGISPLMTSRCITIPDYFLVTNEDVKTFLTSGRTLEEEMKAGKVYIIDYVTAVHNCERSKGFYCADCVGLFYVNKDCDFVPIAIQLVPNNREYLFTPNNNKDDWLLAKMYFRCTTTNVHEWIFHFLHTHSVMEPFTVAFFRCFPRSHPIYKLMRLHLQTILAINSDARTSLIPKDSFANAALSLSALETCTTFFKAFTFEDLIIPKLLKKQGTDDPDLFPKFYYRDDALALWQAMEKYVSNVINYYYDNDQDVQEDFELQDFAQDVALNGLGWQDGNTRGFPKNIATTEQLIKICVTLMFTSSAQHAAVNFGQFDTNKFIPNSLAYMRLPPHKKGEADLDRILKSLPDADQSITIIAITHALSSFSDEEVYLGDYSDQLLFIEQSVLSMQQQYKVKLKKISAEINARNKGLQEANWSSSLPKSSNAEMWTTDEAIRRAIFTASMARNRFAHIRTDDPDLLPKFYYKDDALALWQAMESYVSNVINHYYDNDQDVQEDSELPDFAEDVALNGLGWQDGNTRGFPKNIATTKQLIEICVTVMFTSSAQHAAVNFGQFDTYKFIPNSPACMRLPPHKKGEADLDRILKSLPDADQSITIIAITHVLSSFSKDEVYLGHYPEQLFTEKSVLLMQQQYKDKLEEISSEIIERNEGLQEGKYELLLPSRVPNSIAI